MLRLLCQISILTVFLFPLSITSTAADSHSNGAGSCTELLNHTFQLADSAEKQNLCEAHHGKVLLIVNTASRCGFTPQFDSLEALYEKHRDQGLVVLGFPSNDFKQELAENKAIAKFCRMKYGVSFPVFRKSSVTGQTANPLYKQLIKQTGQAPEWNFYKYLINREGQVVKVYPSRISPEDTEFNRDIEALL